MVSPYVASANGCILVDPQQVTGFTTNQSFYVDVPLGRPVIEDYLQILNAFGIRVGAAFKATNGRPAYRIRRSDGAGGFVDLTLGHTWWQNGVDEGVRVYLDEAP